VHDPDPLSSLNGDVPAPVEAIVQKALRRDPARRYSSAGELMRALKDPERFVESLREPGWNPDTEPKTSWLISLAMIPVSLFLMLLYVASHQ